MAEHFTSTKHSPSFSIGKFYVPKSLQAANVVLLGSLICFAVAAKELNDESPPPPPSPCRSRGVNVGPIPSIVH